MVESVDTKDLKSFGLNSRAGSSPASSTTKKTVTIVTVFLYLQGYCARIIYSPARRVSHL